MPVGVVEGEGWVVVFVGLDTVDVTGILMVMDCVDTTGERMNLMLEGKADIGMRVWVPFFRIIIC